MFFLKVNCLEIPDFQLFHTLQLSLDTSPSQPSSWTQGSCSKYRMCRTRPFRDFRMMPKTSASLGGEWTIERAIISSNVFEHMHSPLLHPCHCMTRYLSICTFLYFIHVIAMTSCTIRHTVEYKSCYLDTVPDNKKPVMLSAPWPASKRFNPSDLKNQNSKYDDATLGTKPASLPYARVTSTGLRAPEQDPKSPLKM